MIDLPASIDEAMLHQTDTIPYGMKTWVDLERYQVVIGRVKPAVVVELGTLLGGSALWLADTAGCPVITVDYKPQVRDDVRERWAGRVTDLVGNTVDPEIVAHVHQLVGDRTPVLVILDSDHAAAHVYSEMVAYHDLVAVDDYLCVEDTLARWMPWFGYDGSPLDAVEFFMACHPGEWVMDYELEGMHPTSQCPGGWLRRIGKG